MSVSFRERLVDAASAPYRASGRFAWHFSRSKLRHDPVFCGLLATGVIPDAARLVDLGCGQGLLASWLRSARRLYEDGGWPADWPPPPLIGELYGVELMPGDVDRARRALQGRAELALGDMRTAELGRADVVVILDVLHYVSFADQARLLRRVRAALRPQGVLVARIGDAAGGAGFRISVGVDRVVSFCRGHRLRRLHCRSAVEWQALLGELGFAVDAAPMRRGTPFANTLLVARVPAAAAMATDEHRPVC
jgi:SAM-dependent methyltransferase